MEAENFRDHPIVFTREHSPLQLNVPPSEFYYP